VLWQLIINAVIAAAALSLVAIGFSLIYRVLKFFHFAHGVVYTLAPYIAFVFCRTLHVPLLPSLGVGVVASIALGCAIEAAVYRPLRQRGSSSLILLLASLGVYIIVQNLISLIFGDEIRSLRAGTTEIGLHLLGARITAIQLLTVGASTVLIPLVTLFTRHTTIGRAMRAIACDEELARVSGIDTGVAILVSVVIGSALAGTAGILVALDVDMIPGMGMNALMMATVAVIIGGASSIPAIAVGSLVLTVAQNLGVWKLSSQWQDAIAFVILALVLLLRPQGLVITPVRKAAV